MIGPTQGNDLLNLSATPLTSPRAEKNSQPESELQTTSSKSERSESDFGKTIRATAKSSGRDKRTEGASEKESAHRAEKSDRSERAGRSGRTETKEVATKDSEKAADAKPAQATPKKSLAKGAVEKTPSAEPSDASARPVNKKQQIMSDFMQGMEQRFGVAPERLVQAMAQLSEQELERSPESTANLVINSLGLPATDRQQAATLYREMLDATALAEVETQEQALPAMPPGPMSIDMQVMSQKEVQAQNLSKGLESLNKSFFPNEKKLKAPENSTSGGNSDAMVQSLAAGNMAPLGSEGKLQSDNSSQQNAQGPQRQAQGQQSSPEFFPAPRGSGMMSGALVSSQRENGALTKNTNSSAEAIKGKPSTETFGMAAALKELGKNQDATTTANVPNPADAVLSADPALTPSADASVMNALTQLLGEIPEGMTEVPLDSANESASESNISDLLQNGEAVSVAGTKDQLTASDERKSESDAKENSDKGPQGPDNGKNEPRVDFQSHLKTDANGKPQLNQQAPVVVQNSQDARSEQIQNLRSIMDRAEVLAQRGGGEMRVQLHPQNLGQVNLRVSVEDGKVNVQMITESDQAKKVLESGIKELRTDLAANNLNLETLQVDTGKGLSSDLRQGPDQQNQAAQDMAREFARGFLNQQREERNWQREQSLMDPMARGGSNYVKNRIEDDSSTESKSLGTSGKARRLNVVV